MIEESSEIDIVMLGAGAVEAAGRTMGEIRRGNGGPGPREDKRNDKSRDEESNDDIVYEVQSSVESV